MRLEKDKLILLKKLKLKSPYNKPLLRKKRKKIQKLKKRKQKRNQKKQ